MSARLRDPGGRWRALVLAGACACLAWASAWAQPLAAIPALDSPVVDTTGTLDAAQRARLERQALDLQRRKGSQLQVLMVASTEPESIEQYTQRVSDQWRLGRAGIDDAVLVVVARDDRRVRIQPGYGLEGAIPDITAGRVIQEYMAPRFRAGDYAGGLVDATAVLVRLIDGEPLPEPMASHRAAAPAGRGGDWLGGLFAAFVTATVVRGFLSRAPGLVRGLATGGAAGGVAWLMTAVLGLGGFAAVLGFLYGLTRAPGGRYVRRGGWGGFGGGGWGGGSGGFGGGGGGWSGGGGMSGGGGASGRW